MTDFAGFIQTYCQNDNEMKRLRKVLKDHNTQQQELSEKIIEHMKQNKLEICNAGELGIITLKKSNNRTALNKDSIKTGIVKILNNQELMSKKQDEIAECGSDLIFNERETVEKCTLKRTNIKTT
jgi:predicted RNase H-like nuclease (RuvC/YqgF family)